MKNWSSGWDRKRELLSRQKRTIRRVAMRIRCFCKTDHTIIFTDHPIK
ncbi:hypothetical protein M5D96_012824 [Drosophila gunungcola]|uniref:Uncharacterized protein n=1 Tax=Drosophila gunungcola TaxID=103775 RepID=A0A9P9YCH4_9MUSC|nr:hypothetical protein M5D96_012824 [Drosophila gunungcola]